MQTLIETLNLYNNADDALYQAEQLVTQLKQQAEAILANNTEPVTMRPIGGVGRGREVTVAADLNQWPTGTVVRVGGIEYMRVSLARGNWIDCIGCKTDCNTLFRHMLNQADDCFLVHVGN